MSKPIVLDDIETAWLFKHMTSFPGYPYDPTCKSILDKITPAAEQAPQGHWEWINYGHWEWINDD
jgi:hypothetical protein